MRLGACHAYPAPPAPPHPPAEFSVTRNTSGSAPPSFFPSFFHCLPHVFSPRIPQTLPPRMSSPQTLIKTQSAAGGSAAAAAAPELPACPPNRGRGLVPARGRPPPAAAAPAAAAAAASSAPKVKGSPFRSLLRRLGSAYVMLLRERRDERRAVPAGCSSRLQQAGRQEAGSWQMGGAKRR